MLATERRPPPAQLRGSAGFLLAGGGVEEADQVQDRALRQQRRGVVLVDVLLDPVVVVADAAELLDVHAPDRFEAHAHARRVQVRLEGDDLGVLLQRGVGVDLLVRGVRLDVEVVAVAEQRRRTLVERLVALGEEPEAELEVRVGVVAVGVDVRRVQIQHRVGGQQPAGRLGELVGVAADLVDRPAGAARAARAPSSDRSCDGRHSGRPPSWPTCRAGCRSPRAPRPTSPSGPRSGRSATEPIEPHLSGATAGTKTFGPRDDQVGLAEQPAVFAHRRRPWPAAGRRRCRAARRCRPTSRWWRSRPR